MSDHNLEDPLDSILNGNNEATKDNEDNAITNTPDLSPGLIDIVTTNKFFNFFKILYILRRIQLTVEEIPLSVVEAASQKIIVTEQTLFKTEVGTPNTINGLKN